MANDNNSLLDAQQVLARAFNVSNHTLRTNTLVPDAFDYIEKVNSAADEETFTYKMGGSAGSVVGTIVVTYTDGSKEDILSVERTV